MSLIIGIDIGTTSTKTIAFDQLGHVVYQADYGCRLIAKEEGQAEEKPQDILQAVVLGLKEVTANIDNSQLRGIGFSSAMHTLLLIDQNHQPLTNVYTWADNRATDVFKRDIVKDNLFSLSKNTGVPLHPMLPFAKLLWLKENFRELWERKSFVVDIKSYILYQFTHKYYVDYATANATGLFNVKTKNWDSSILEYLELDKKQLPQLVDTIFQIQANSNLINVPLIIGGSDGTMANLSNPKINRNFYAVSCGTSAAVRTNIHQLKIDSNRKLFTYYQYKNEWIIGAPTNNAGDVWKWLKNQILNVKSYKKLNSFGQSSPVGAKNLFFIPYIFGERAPIWNPQATGGFFGLTSVHTYKDMARSVLEGEIYNIDLIIKELNQFTCKKPESLVLTGGMAKSNFFDQLLADITGYQVDVPQTVEASALGAAIMAMISLKIIDSPYQIQKELTISKIFIPSFEKNIKYRLLKKRWFKIKNLVVNDWIKK